MPDPGPQNTPKMQRAGAARDEQTAALGEEDCHRRAQRLMNLVPLTRDMQRRRRLLQGVMRWHNRAMIAHDRDLTKRGLS